jgi:hypothetical protein
MPEPNFTCNTCGKEGYKKPSWLNKVSSHYCNQNCFKKRPLKFQTVQCLHCSKFYEKRDSSIKKSSKHLCSKDCKYSYLRKKIKVSCEYCNKDFEKSLCDSKRTNGNFCSRQCSGKSRQQRISVKCSFCENNLEITPFNQKKFSNYFCDKKCTDNFRKNRQTVQCTFCEKTMERTLYKVQKSENYFCSRECNTKYKLSFHIEVSCLVCSKNFLKNPRQIRIRPRHCCSHQCARLLTKLHKDWGSKRSKLELEVEKYLTEFYPYLKIKYNKTDIGNELDIYIPELDLAFEINGPTHYRPIYSEEHFLRTQKTDKQKKDECLFRKIKLVIIDVSTDKAFNEKNKNLRIAEITAHINDRINELNYNPEIKQLSMEF